MVMIKIGNTIKLLFWILLFFQGNNLVAQEVDSDPVVDSLLEELIFADDNNKVIIYSKLAKRYQVKSLDTAKEYAKKALEFSMKIEDKESLANSYRLLGNIYYYQGSYNEVVQYYDSCAVLYELINDSIGLSKVWNNLGMVYQSLGNYEKALDFLNRALNYRIAIGDSSFLGSLYNNIGGVYYDLGKLESSYYYFDKALNIAVETSDTQSKASVINNLGLILLEQKKYKEAIKFFQNGITEAEKFDNRSVLSDIYHNLGKCYFELDDYTKALEYYHKALDVDTEVGAKKAHTLNNIAQVYIELDYYESALKYLLRAEQIAKKNHSLSELRDVFNNLAVVYERLGNFKNAYSCYMEYNIYDDSIKKQAYSSRLEEEKTLHRVESKQKEIEKIKLKNQIQLEKKENQLRRKNIIIYGYTIGSIIVLFFLFWVYRMYVQKRKANRLLLKQNEEIVKADKVIKDVNRALKENELRLRRIVQEMPVMINAFGDDGVVTFWNIECERVTGYSADEIIGNKNVLQMLYPDRKYRKFLQKEILDHNFSYKDYETNISCKDGTVKTISWSSASHAAPIPGWKYWEIGIDVTERVKAENIVLKNQEMLRGIFDSSPSAIIVIDLNYMVIESNPPSHKMFKVENDQELKKFSIFDFIPEDEHSLAKEKLKESFEKGFSNNNQYKLIRFDESTFYAETSSSVIKDSSGNPVAIVVVVNDITERLTFIEKLKQAKAVAEQSDKLKTAFLANMSHEIRTPMNSIIGFSNLLTDEGVEEIKKTEYLHHIIKSSNALLSLIDDIIDISKIEAEQLTISKSKFKLNSAIRELFNSFSESNKNDKVKLKLVFPPDSDIYEIDSDPLRMRQVLTNLIGNALKFTEKGTVEVGYSIEGKGKDAIVRFYVSDTGIGIPRDMHKTVFERFRQVDETTSRKFGGTGLGLAISKRIVELLNGEIWVKSEPGKGSVFYFTLPFVMEENKSPGKEKFWSSQYNWKERTILVAEDEDTNFELLKAALHKTKVNLIWVVNGLEAVETCRTNKNIDLVLMDIRMPKMNGYEATKKIKSFNENLPVIALTAYAMPEDRAKSIEAGCDLYFSKPIRPSKLLSSIEEFFQ
jgi:PAS domain S-box-containing protein